MMKNKKVWLTILAAILLVALGIGGTLAWITASTASLENTFTIGDLAITLDEENWDPDNAKIVPGAEIDKDPVVTVEEGSEPCWVFVKVEVPTAISAVASLDIDGTKWTVLPGVSNVYYYYQAVDASAADVPLPVFTTVSVSETASNAQIAAITTPNDTITVTAYAIQKDAGTTAALAWTAAAPATW